MSDREKPLPSAAPEDAAEEEGEEEDEAARIMRGEPEPEGTTEEEPYLSCVRQGLPAPRSSSPRSSTYSSVSSASGC